MTFIWAARGYSWGFTFLSTGGFSDPLLPYEKVQPVLEGQPSGCARVGDAVSLKFTDPEGRRDRAGRPIAHSFVLYGDLADRVATVEDGLRLVWPLVADWYAQVWQQPVRPQSHL